MSAVTAVARAMRIDSARSSPSLLVRIRGVAVIVGVVTSLAVLAATASDRDLTSTRSMAVTSDEVVGFDTPGLRSVIDKDPAAALARGDVDLAVIATPEGYRVLLDPDDDDSVDAETRFAVAVAAADRPPAEDVATTVLVPARAVRDRSIATAVLFGLAFAAQSALSAGSQSSGATNNRALEPLLLVPMPRRQLAAAFAIGQAPALFARLALISVAVVAVILVPLPGLGLRASSLGGTSAGVAIAVAGLLPIGVGVLAVTTVGMAGRQRRVIGLAVTLPFILGGFLAAQRVVAPPEIFGWLPVLSNAGIAADGILRTIEPWPVLRSLVVGFAIGAVLVEAAGRMADRDAAISR